MRMRRRGHKLAGNARGWRDEAMLHEDGQRRLNVERMFAGESNKVGVARYPAVGCVGVPAVNLLKLHLLCVER